MGNAKKRGRPRKKVKKKEPMSHEERIAKSNATLEKKVQELRLKIIKTLPMVHGNISATAHLCGVSRITVWNYAQKFEDIQDAIAEAKEIRTDFVEGKMMDAISDGDTSMMRFYLLTQAKDRGYIKTRHNLNEDVTPRKSLTKPIDKRLDSKKLEVLAEIGETEFIEQ